MSTLLFVSEQDPPDLWLPALRDELPEIEVREYPEVGARADIEYALVYWPPQGLLATLPNLKLIHSIAAGVDHILADQELPDNVPIVRMVDDYLRDMMSEYAIYAVLHFHRDFGIYRERQLKCDWKRGWPLYTPDTNVGVLGIGAIGSDIAKKMLKLGFCVHGWSRGQRNIEGVVCHHGKDGLFELLSKCQYVICVLPLTSSTVGIINEESLAVMPRGSYIINIARGGHVVDKDLISALDSGHLAGAFLDVFNDEPLGADHPYWLHPGVTITPHVAGELVPQSCVKTVGRHLRAHIAGRKIDGLLDRGLGY